MGVGVNEFAKSLLDCPLLQGAAVDVCHLWDLPARCQRNHLARLRNHSKKDPDSYPEMAETKTFAHW